MQRVLGLSLFVWFSVCVNAVPHATSFMASIRNGQFGQFECGAVLVASKYLVTAAHCIRGTSTWAAIGGLHASGDDGEWLQIKQATVHPKYSHITLDFDVAVVELRYSSTRDPIDIHWGDDELVAPGSRAVMRGFGMTNTNPSWSTLRENSAAVWSSNDCRRGYHSQLPTDQVCVAGGGIPLCTGDEGGPLMVLKDDKPHLTGIGSFFCNCTSIPAVYTRTSHVRDFIEPFLAMDRNREIDERPTRPPILEMARPFAGNHTHEGSLW